MQVGASLAAGRGRLPKETHDSYAKWQAIKLGALLLVGIVVVVGAVVGFQFLRPAPVTLVGDDAQARDLIRDRHYQEIRSWLSQGHDRFLMGHTISQSQALAEEIYRLEPKQVMAGGGRTSMAVIIELPEDPEARSRLIAWINNWNEKYVGGKPPQTDVGQRYLVAEMPMVR